MAVTTSIGPGATNLLTAAALAHVNRLPVLLLPGDAFASRVPDPVLQQVEDFGAGDISANDAFRPMVRYFDRISRPEQILAALPRAVQVMTDPATCGPVCLALPQDVQTMAFDCPASFLEPEPLRIRRPAADARELHAAVALLRAARQPIIVAGGGVLYSQAGAALAAFAQAHGVPVSETQAGKGSLAWDDALNVGAVGVTGAPAANALAADADVVIAVGTRLQDFTTGSHALFAPAARHLAINVQPLDAARRGSMALVADARSAIAQLDAALAGWHADAAWSTHAKALALRWNERVTALTTHDPTGELPYDAEVIGAVRDSAPDSAGGDIVVCAAGTLPAELHKLWRTSHSGGYHMEYGYSCMGYEIAGGLGVKLARPEREVIVMLGDGSYLMLNSEIATSVMLGCKLIIVVLDNRGYGCIQRLQLASGSPRFNNLLEDCRADGGSDVRIDFAAHARSLGAEAVHAASVAELKAAMQRARGAAGTQVIVIDTSPWRTTDDGGAWWEVAIPEVSNRAEVREARERYLQGKARQRL
jgi:3D-(3,5/4)-trihydroxycyclohexane-1,2-dione acylhydrolase (decyclizing)